MLEKIAYLIRKFLLKQVVPAQKRKAEFQRKFRLSLKFRIAYAYGKIMIINSIIILLIFFLAFLKICETSYYSKIEGIINNIQEKSELLDGLDIENSVAIFYKEDKKYVEVDDDEIDSYKKYIYHKRVNPYSKDELTMRIYNKDYDIVYDDIDKCYIDKCNLFGAIYLNGKADNTILCVIENREFFIDGEKYVAFFQIDFSNEVIVFKKLIGFMLIVIVVLAIILVSGGLKRTKFIFDPISQMANITNRMTINNLSSDRLNIEGTNNELKDLAMTINKMLDRLDISYESQKQFVSDASHELRTPIAVIQGYINMLDRWGKSDEAVMEESIEAIKNEAQTMKELVEKLLFLSRHDKKTLKLNKSVFNVKKIVDEMVKETTLVEKKRNIYWENLEDVRMYGDKQSIKQVLRILIDNAIKYSDEGADIYISCKKENKKCVIEVRDTGFGMTKYDLENVFERFYRSDNVRDKKIVGNGLGLSLAKLIVLKHTGTIVVTSQLNKGTSFKLYFNIVSKE